jgi:hypothetical protein
MVCRIERRVADLKLPWSREGRCGVAKDDALDGSNLSLYCLGKCAAAKTKPDEQRKKEREAVALRHLGFLCVQ